MSGFEFADLWQEAIELRSEVRASLSSTDVPRCQELASSLSKQPDPVLSLAFIGQYNAGKSSLIRALTGTDDVVVDANVATDRVVEVRWNGLRLLDTPGVHAGRAGHDALTEEAIASSDLLIFVITAELFDATIGDYFREIVLDRNRASECLLVVNKSAQDPGTRDTKLAALAEVLAPLEPPDLPIVFVDVQCKELSEDAEDPEERLELLELSGFDEFVTSIDDFARRSGLRGQVTTPVHESLLAIDDAVALLSDDDDVRLELELLARHRAVLRGHRSELSESVRGSIAETRNALSALGDEVAALIVGGVEPGVIETAMEERGAAAERLVDALDSEIEGSISAAVARLQADLEMQQRLALEFLDGSIQTSTERPSPGADIPRGPTGSTLPPEAIEWLNSKLPDISSFFLDHSGAGEKGHALVYGIGKRLGVKFRPWGAVKTARFLGKLAQGLQVLGPAFELWSQISAERRAREIDQALETAKLNVRGAFYSMANSVAQESQRAIATYLQSTFDSALAHLEERAEGLIHRRAGADDLTERLGELRSTLGALLERVRGPVGSDGPQPVLNPGSSGEGSRDRE